MDETKAKAAADAAVRYRINEAEGLTARGPKSSYYVQAVFENTVSDDRANKLLEDAAIKHGYGPWSRRSAARKERASVFQELYVDHRFEKSCRIIVPDFHEVSLELIEYFSTRPEKLQNLEWRIFEELLESIFKNQGFHTELGPGSADGGVDLRLLQKDTIGEIVTLVQAKKYKTENPICLEPVQALYGVVEAEKANRGLFVTTSRYLPSAKRFADRQKRRLTLANSDDVAKWCASIVRK